MNRGARAVAAELKRRGWTQKRLAEWIGIGAPLLSRILRDERKPGRVAAAKFYRKLGTDPSLWDQEC